MGKKNILMWVIVALTIFGRCVFAEEAQKGPRILQSVEKYEKKVILRAKWGTETGKFAYRQWEGEADYPKSFAIDSKENIYILDQYNNRIQVFDDKGNYIKKIPIESYKLANEEEIKQSQKTWNKFGNPFSVIRVDRLVSYNDKLYAFQSKKIDDKIEQNLLEHINDETFVKLEDEKLKTIKNSINRKEKIKSLIAGKTKFKLEKSKLIYDEKEIREGFSDDASNLYLLNMDNHLRKYDQKENMIMDLITEVGYMTNQVVVSKKGNIFIMKLFSERHPDKEGYLSIDDYDGIEVVKWSPL